MDESNPHISSSQQISKKRTSEGAAGFQPVSCGLSRVDNSFSVDCWSIDHSPLSKQQESSNIERRHLPPNVDPEVFRCLPEEIQREMSFNFSDPSIYTSTESHKNDALQEASSSTVNAIKPPGSVFGDLKTDNCLFLPGNVDSTVFAELPPEVQKELMSEWRHDKPILKAPSSKKPIKNLTGKGKKATAKSIQSNSLLNYFKPH